MLDHWLFPLPDSLSEPDFPPHSFGDKLQLHNKKGLPDLRRTRVALVGLDARTSRSIREALYELSFPFKRFPVADLGNLRRKTPSFAMGLLQELLSSRIVPVLLAPSPDFLEPLFDAFNELRKHTSLCLIQQRPHLRPGEGVGRLLKKRPFHLGLIGCQAHFILPADQKKLDQLQVDLVRLGKARSNLAELEPIIRDADLVGFDLSALRGGDVPGLTDPTPSGFTVEEGCQIMRYAGLSDKLGAAAIVGYQKTPSLTAQAIAQLVWYFLDGVHQRKQDFPVSTQDMVEYVVEVRQLDFQLTFWKSNKSGRWWFQLPHAKEVAEQRHRLVPCSYRDYLQASEGELPDRLHQALKRFS